MKNEPKEVLNWRFFLSAVVFGLMGAARGLDVGTIGKKIRLTFANYFVGRHHFWYCQAP